MVLRRVDRETLGVADVCEVAEELETVDELLAGLLSSLDTDTDQRPEASLEVFHRKFVVGVIRQARVCYPCDLRVGFEELCNGECVLRVPGDPQVEGFKAEEERPCIERADDCTGIPEK